MSKKNVTPEAEAVKQPRKKKEKKGSGLLGRIIRRFFLLLFTVVVMAAVALVLVMNMIFNGPSTAAREMLTMALIEASATKWVPALFIGEDGVAEIRTSINVELEEDVTDISEIIIQMGASQGSSSADEWKDHPDGIKITTEYGPTYTAHVMLVRDPSQVYVGVSNEKGFSRNVPGMRLTEAIEEYNALAAVNAGAFFDNGTTGSEVGSTPEGLVYSKGSCVWKHGAPPNGLRGFAGFTEDNVLVVAKEMTQSKADELKIRDGCEFGPVLIINGEMNQSAYSDKSGVNPRTAIGQRADGAVIFVCIDGRQAGSLGGTYADIIDIMMEYGAVNACNLDGGSSSVMLYRDQYGLFGAAGEIQPINSYSLFQTQPRRMPNFWLVKAAE